MHREKEDAARRIAEHSLKPEAKADQIRCFGFGKIKLYFICRNKTHVALNVLTLSSAHVQ